MYLTEWRKINAVSIQEIARRTKYSKQVVSLSCLGSGYCANKKLIEKIKVCFPEGEKCCPNGFKVWEHTNELESYVKKKEKESKKVVRVPFTDYEKDLLRKYYWVVQTYKQRQEILNGKLVSEKVKEKILKRLYEEKARCEEIDRKIESGEIKR